MYGLGKMSINAMEYYLCLYMEATSPKKRKRRVCIAINVKLYYNE